ncbi:MAG: response regulator [Candidatus Marinimicrobia bacterium]|nr:response regulator [Candidatus Neomarinimicrobiota bacterium]
MEALQQHYREALAARIDALETARSSHIDGDTDALESIKRVAHTLKGSGGTFGFPEITAAAEAVGLAGSGALVEKVDTLLAILHEVMQGGEARLHELLVIEDEPVAAKILQTRLEQNGYLVHMAKTGAEAEALLEQEQISLVLLDLILPDMDGRNFLVKLRERPKYAALPLMVTSGQSGSTTKAECFALGADGFFEKPLDLDTLMAAVAAKLQRSGEIIREARTDPLTQLPNRAALHEAFQRAQSAAVRSHESMALAILDIDHFKAVNDTHGHATGDKVLRRVAELLVETARQTDMVARWGGEEFVILYPKATQSGASQALDKSLLIFRSESFSGEEGESFNVSFSAGVVEVEKSATLEEAVAEADHLLYLAKESGRNRVLTHQSAVVPAVKKVLLAEDDDIVASVVKSHLERDGFEIVHFLDGAEALRAAAELEVKLAILDIKMPGLDGFQLLASLRKMPAYQDIPIVILTSMGSEEDIVRGFKLGADDYIMKPFSPVELLARIRRLVKS